MDLFITIRYILLQLGFYTELNRAIFDLSIMWQDINDQTGKRPVKLIDFVNRKIDTVSMHFGVCQSNQEMIRAKKTRLLHKGKYHCSGFDSIKHMLLVLM